MADPPQDRVPHHSIIPIITSGGATSGRDLIKGFLGTGFFVEHGDEIVIVTAKHVLEGQGFDSTHLPAYVFHEGSAAAIMKPRAVVAHPAIDVAVMRIDSPPPSAVPLRFASRDLPLNKDALCVEYSMTTITLHGERKNVEFTPLSHKGNIVAHPATGFMRIATPCFLTSFPALAGASGAPVMDENFNVVGMIVGNADLDSQPAKITRVVEPDGVSEEVRYVLPYGIGLRLQPLLDAMNAIRWPSPG